MYNGIITTILFAILKIHGYVVMDWWLVVAPLWISTAVETAVLLLAIVITCAIGIVKLVSIPFCSNNVEGSSIVQTDTKLD